MFVTSPSSLEINADYGPKIQETQTIFTASKALLNAPHFQELLRVSGISEFDC